MKRRTFLAGLGTNVVPAGTHGAAQAEAIAPSRSSATASAPALARAHVLVIGGGYGGATAARYLRVFSGHRLPVTLVEPESAFVSCPLSNLVLTGARSLADLTRPYDTLWRRHGVRIVRDRVVRIDPVARRATLASGTSIPYDRLVLAPGIELMFDAVEGLAEARRDGRVLQAWQAGAETVALARQLRALPDGGTVAIAIPEAPYRCPPAPYERASLIAAWLKRTRPRAKLLVLDANPDVVSKGALFKRVWAESYAGLLEYRPEAKAIAVDAATGTIRFEFADDVRADVLNVLPPMRAGRIAVDTGLANSNGRWCQVRWEDFGSTVAPDLHVIGDAIQIGTQMPKSGSMANAQAKVVAASIVAALAELPPDPAPLLVNTCYSFVDETRAVHVASVHAWQAASRSFEPVPGAGGLSAAPNTAEAVLAFGWARAIRADLLG